jgi:hypothetical protein
MNAPSDACSEREVELVQETFQRIAGDLAMITDRELVLVSVKAAGAVKRAAGRDKIHISFKLGFRGPSETRHGCLVMPVADAISVACYLMMVPDDGVKSKRSLQTLDNPLKDAMLEVGNFIGGATDAALRALGFDHVKVGFEGCQGVKPDVRPAFLYNDGEPLLIGRARAKLHQYPEFEMMLMLPELPAA